jgi:uncharacterized protein (DUF983 family)
MRLARAKLIIGRGLWLRCPRCGEGRLFNRIVRMNRACGVCEMEFWREQGYFVGAIYFNVMATEGLIFFTYLALILFYPAADPKIFTVLFIMAVLLPILFYRHARSLWLSFDYMIDPPEKRPGLRPVD